MTRPDHLPDYATPPLDEIVLGVQFSPIPSYSSVNAHSIWDLFKTEFPQVQEHPLLDPKFETFGGTNPQAGFQLQLGPPQAGSRLWFSSLDNNHLLQFQPDRFLSNWRRQQPSPQEYPRFEGVSDSFQSNLLNLEELLKTEFSSSLEINQAEIAYINIIPVEDFSEASKWFDVWNDGALNIESMNTSFNEVARDHENKPYARLNHEIQSVVTVDGQHKAFKLSLTFRGKPFESNVESAMNFLKDGRNKIVTRFDEITTEYAHTFWEKK